MATPDRQVADFPIDFVDDIDGTTRHVNFRNPPMVTFFKLLWAANLNPSEARVRKAIALGGRQAKFDEDSGCDDIFSIPHLLHRNRPLMEGVIESQEMIARAAVQARKEIRFGNLSGREPKFHLLTQNDQFRDGVRTSEDELYLNPGVGSKSWKAYWIHSRLTGEGDPTQASNVVLREDDLEAVQLCAALNRLPEVQEVGTKVLVYWKQHRLNNGFLLWRAGVKLEEGVIPFRDHMTVAHDFIEKMQQGLI